MLDVGGRDEKTQGDLHWRSLRDDGPRMEDEHPSCDHVRAAAQAGVAGRLWGIVILVATRNLGRDVAFIRLQQVAGEHLHCHEEQQKHRRGAKQLGQDLHHPYFDTGGMEAYKLLNLMCISGEDWAF